MKHIKKSKTNEINRAQVALEPQSIGQQLPVSPPPNFNLIAFIKQPRLDSTFLLALVK